MRGPSMSLFTLAALRTGKYVERRTASARQGEGKARSAAMRVALRLLSDRGQKSKSIQQDCWPAGCCSLADGMRRATPEGGPLTLRHHERLGQLDQFLDPITSLIEVVATIYPRRHRAPQTRHNAFSGVSECNRRATSFVSPVLSKQAQVLHEIVETLDIGRIYEKRLGRSALGEDDVVPSQLYMKVLDFNFSRRMKHDRRAVDEINGLEEHTIHPKCVLLGDEQIAARYVRSKSTSCHPHGENALGMSPTGGTLVQTATNPCDWLCLTAQSCDQITDAKVLDLSFTVRGLQERSRQEAGMTATATAGATATGATATRHRRRGHRRRATATATATATAARVRMTYSNL